MPIQKQPTDTDPQATGISTPGGGMSIDVGGQNLNVTPQQVQQLQALKGSNIQNLTPQVVQGLQALPPNFMQGFNIEQGAGGGKKDPAAAPAPAATDPSTATSVPDALTAGIGMFLSQYLAPLMQAQNQTNNAMATQWGNQMQQALQNPMPAGVKQLMEAAVPQAQQTLEMQNTAAMNQAYGAIPFQQLMTGLQSNTAVQQALADAYEKAATQQLIFAGQGGQLGGQLASALGGNSTLAGLLAQTLASPSTTGSTGGAQTPAASTTGPGTTSPAVTGLAGTLLNAGNAAATAGAGYNPLTGTSGYNPLTGTTSPTG